MVIQRHSEEVEDSDHGRHVFTEERRVADRHLGEEEVVSSRSSGWDFARGWVRVLALWLAIALAVVETLIGFRLAFLLAAANPNNGFVDFIYDVSDPLVEPFQGIIANETVGDNGLFEPASVIAMAVYLVIGAFLIAFILAITSGPSAGGDRVVTSRSRHSSAYDH